MNNYLDILEPVKKDFTRYGDYFEKRWKTFAYAMQMLRGNGIDPDFTHVLELGTGNGYLSSLLAQVSGRVTGIDIAEGTARTCEAGFRHAGKLLALTSTANVTLKDGVMEDIPVEDNSVDLVFSAYVLEHVMDLERGLEECNRVLREKGIMVSIVPGAMDKLVYLFSTDYLKHTALSALRPFLYLLGVRKDLQTTPWRLPFAPWPHDVRKTFFQELREYRLGSWLELFRRHSLQVLDVGRKRARDHIIITRKVSG